MSAVLLFACVVCAAVLVGASVLPTFSTAPAIPTIEEASYFWDGVLSLTNSSDGGSHVVPSQTFGYFSYGEGRSSAVPMYEEAHFPIGSNSKLFTTVALYQLHEQEGLFDMDQDIATLLDANDFDKFGLAGKEHNATTAFCPMLPNSTTCEVLTIRQLLSMQSGLYPTVDCNEPQLVPGECNLASWIVSPGTIAKMVGTFLLDPLVFKPGTQYHYTNPNFVLATYFVEKFSNLTFAKYLKENIFKPLGLKNTYYDWFNNQIRRDPHRVRQYYKTYNAANQSELLSVGETVMQFDLGVVSGAGGLVSTKNDLAIMWRTLFNATTKGAPLLKNPKSVQDILSPYAFQGKGQLPAANGSFVPVYSYFGQGMGIVCLVMGCPTGPDFILYEGGTETVSTANFMDYRSGTPGLLGQVWTSTVAASMTPAQLETLLESEEGLAMYKVAAYPLPASQFQVGAAITLVLQQSPIN